MSCSEHKECYHIGIIQQDVSANNIISNSKVGHLIDFDYSKVTQQFKPQINSNYQRIRKSLYQVLLKYFEKLAILQVEEMMGNYNHTHEYLSHLKIDKVCTRLLLFNDLGWHKELYICPLSKEATGFSSSFVTFLCLICIILDLVISQYVLKYKYLSLSDLCPNITYIYELYVGYPFCVHCNL